MPKTTRNAVIGEFALRRAGETPKIGLRLSFKLN